MEKKPILNIVGEKAMERLADKHSLYWKEKIENAVSDSKKYPKKI